jgi:hypothetical protein
MKDNKKWIKEYMRFSDRDLDYNRGIPVGKVIDLLNDYETELKLHLDSVNPSTLLDTHVVLCKPNYLAKDGSIKLAIVNNYEGLGTWLAPKDDLY